VSSLDVVEKAPEGQYDVAVLANLIQVPRNVRHVLFNQSLNRVSSLLPETGDVPTPLSTLVGRTRSCFQ